MSQALINVIGHLVAKPELKGEGDKQYAFAKVMHNPTPRSKDVKPDPIAFEVLLSGQDAKYANAYADKGTQVAVAGEVTEISVASNAAGIIMSQSTGKAIVNTKVVAYRSTFRILDKKADSGQGTKTMSASAGSAEEADDSGAPF